MLPLDGSLVRHAKLGGALTGLDVALRREAPGDIKATPVR